MTAADLAKITGFSVGYIYSLSSGRRRKSGRAAVERALGVTLWPKADNPEGKA